jgi:hypothetical protein
MKGKRCKWNPPCLCHLDRWVSIYFHPRTFSLPPQVGQVLESSGTRSKFSFLLRFIGYSCICAERLFRALEDDLWGTLEWKISRQAHNFFYMVCLFEPFHVPVFCTQRLYSMGSNYVVLGLSYSLELLGEVNPFKQVVSQIRTFNSLHIPLIQSWWRISTLDHQSLTASTSI